MDNSNCGCGGSGGVASCLKPVPYYSPGTPPSARTPICLPPSAAQSSGSGGCGCGGSCGCGCGGGAGGPLEQVASAVENAVPSPKTLIPGLTGWNYSIDPRIGSLSVGISGPAASKVAANPVFTYNSRAAGSTIQFGYGWSDVFNPTVSPIGKDNYRLTCMRRVNGAATCLVCMPPGLVFVTSARYSCTN